MRFFSAHKKNIIIIIINNLLEQYYLFYKPGLGNLKLLESRGPILRTLKSSGPESTAAESKKKKKVNTF